jgi:hypothetical protein
MKVQGRLLGERKGPRERERELREGNGKMNIIRIYEMSQGNPLLCTINMH